MVLNLGSIEPQGFDESVSGIQKLDILSDKNKINKIHDTHFICPTTKGSMNACMELVGFSTSNMVENHCGRIKARYTIDILAPVKPIIR